MPGYPIRILDGNHLAGTEHRIKELRALRAGALPGQALVVLDPDAIRRSCAARSSDPSIVVGRFSGDYGSILLGSADISPTRLRIRIQILLTLAVVDDLIAYLYAEDRVFLIPNAANSAEVVRRLRAAAPEGVTVTSASGRFPIVVPEPATLAFLLAGGLGLSRRRTR